MENIKSLYNGKKNKTIFVCKLCKRRWEMNGKKSSLLPSEKLYLVNHDRSHNIKQ